MSNSNRNILLNFAQMFQYPDLDWLENIVKIANLSGILENEVRAELNLFLSKTHLMSLTELEELYTRTFDLNPVCALELGWHEYGEQYARGGYMAMLTRISSDLNIVKTPELPDHISNVLAILAKMSDDLYEEFFASVVEPPLSKMQLAFKKVENPFEHLFNSMCLHLKVRQIEATENSIELPTEIED